MAKGGRFQALDVTVKELSKELVRMKTQCDIKSSVIADEKKSLESIISNQKEVRGKELFFRFYNYHESFYVM